jgi:molybdopterin molybdotransferase
MHTVESALAAVMRECRVCPTREMAASWAAGWTLAERVVADLDMPPFDKALVDGFAVRSSDVPDTGPWSLRVVDEIDAGTTPRRALGAGEAALVMTGAPLPEGADAVVMLEEVRRDDSGWAQARGPVKAGQNRLERGREYGSGEVLLEPGTMLNAPRVGLLAATGHPVVRVFERPTVGVVATGDELVEPDQAPGPGQIRNSNTSTLASLVRSLGHGAREIPTLPDRLPALRDALGRIVTGRLDEDGERAGFEPVDALLVCGGVSAGRRDLVPSALEAVGVRPVFHKVKVKPGKPLWFGVGPERAGRPPVLVFGLPGNPVSGIVSVLLFAAPALEVMAGRPASGPRTERLVLASPYSQRGPRATYHPARRLAGGRVAPLPWAGSADLRTVALADGFAVFPEGDRDYDEGVEVEFLPLPSTPMAPGA